MGKSRYPNRLKKYRRVVDLSQRKVAAILGLYDSGCISRWEKGVCLPDLINTIKLCLLFKVLPHELYDELYEKIQIDMQPNLFAHDEPIDSNSNEYDLTEFF